MPEIKGRRSALADSAAIGAVEASATSGAMLRLDVSQSHNDHSPRDQRAIDMSPRQEQVLRLLSQGRTDKEIAQELDISPRTVQTHMKNFLAKNRIRTRLEAVATFSCHICRSS